MNAQTTATNAYSIKQDRLGSSLLLQQFLYYQKFFSFCWFIANMTLITYKRTPTAKHIRGSRIISFTFTMVFAAVEFLRLPCGSYGNLREDVATLGVFILLTLEQMIVPSFLLSNKNRRRWAPDLAANSVLLIMLGLEFIFAISAIMKIITENKRRFVISEMFVRAQRTHAGAKAAAGVRASAYMSSAAGPAGAGAPLSVQSAREFQKNAAAAAAAAAAAPSPPAAYPYQLQGQGGTFAAPAPLSIPSLSGEPPAPSNPSFGFAQTTSMDLAASGGALGMGGGRRRSNSRPGSPAPMPPAGYGGFGGQAGPAGPTAPVDRSSLPPLPGRRVASGAGGYA